MIAGAESTIAGAELSIGGAEGHPKSIQIDTNGQQTVTNTKGHYKTSVQGRYVHTV